MNPEELKAAGLLLDQGVAIPLRPLRFLDVRKQPRMVTIRHPYAGGLIRMSQQFSAIGVTHEEMKDYSIDQNMSFIAEHGKAVSHLVAGAIVRSDFGYRLLGGLVAWWLRWRVHPVFLSEAMYQLRENVHINPFNHIIRSAQAINLMKPRLSH
jgi:hypothetical protein